MSRYTGVKLFFTSGLFELRLFCEAGGIVCPKSVADRAKRPRAN